MKTLDEVFQGVLWNAHFTGDPKLMKYNETPGWDSLAHMSLTAALEENFDVMFEITDIADISSYDAAKKVLKKHGIDA